MPMTVFTGRRVVGVTPDSQGSRPTGFPRCSCGNSYSGTQSLAFTRPCLKEAKRLTSYGFSLIVGVEVKRLTWYDVSLVGDVSSGAPGGQQASAMAEAMARLEQFRYQR